MMHKRVKRELIFAGMLGRAGLLAVVIGVALVRDVFWEGARQGYLDARQELDERDAVKRRRRVAWPAG